MTIEGPLADQRKKKRIFTPEILLKEIRESKRDLFVFENKVYDATSFKNFHPGGFNAIDRMVGKDATDEVKGFHPPWVLEKKIPHYCIGEFLNPNDLNSPSNSPLAKKYRQLDMELREAGFYEPDMKFYYRRFVFFFFVWLSSIYILLQSPGDVFNICLSAVLMGLLWHGLSFLTHDAGHNSLSGIRNIDYGIGIFVASFIGGLSVSWWKDNHNIHHIVTNDPAHDPDIQHMPFFAVTTEFFKSIYSTYHKRMMKFDRVSQLFISIQNYSFIPILTFGRFNLQFISLSYLLNFNERREHRYVELFGILVFFSWFGYWLIGTHIPTLQLQLLYWYISYASTVLLHLQITLSHFAMSTTPVENELFIDTCMRTTMNIDCPEYLDWIHGGLQFQIEHHLFPRLPRSHFRKVSPIVRQFCDENNLHYHSYSFVGGNRLVFNTLGDIADQVKLLWFSSNPEVRYKEQ